MNIFLWKCKFGLTGDDQKNVFVMTLALQHFHCLYFINATLMQLYWSVFTAYLLMLQFAFYV